MKITKRFLTACAAAAVIAVTSVTALAASAYETPAAAAAGLTGRTEESVAAERQESGKTWGAIAAEAGKLDEFKAEMLELRGEELASQVASGAITQERATEIMTAIEANQAVCDGTGAARTGQAFGACFGGGEGCGAGQGQGCGSGLGQGCGGRGAGCGMNGACVNG